MIVKMEKKAEIVQKLLDDKKITVEEAVILLKENSYPVYIPYNQPYTYPTYPTYPSQPTIWYGSQMGETR